MNELLKTELFGLLSEPLQENTTKELQDAYWCFVEKVKTVCQSDNNKEVFRKLNLARIELVSIESFYQHGEEKKSH